MQYVWMWENKYGCYIKWSRLVFWEESSVSSPGKVLDHWRQGKPLSEKAVSPAPGRGDGNLYCQSSRFALFHCGSEWYWILNPGPQVLSMNFLLYPVLLSVFFLIACEIWMDFYVFKELRDQKNILCHENCMNLKFFLSIAKTCRNWSHPLLLLGVVVVVVPTCGCFLI